MQTNNKVNIHLPNLKPTVLLSPALACTLQIIIDGGDIGATSIQLIDSGIYSALNNVSKLRKLGAIIQTIRADGKDQHNRVHHNIAHYTYHGWDVEYHPY